jgi:DNA-binding transcriptional ArsR family regulator
MSDSKALLQLLSAVADPVRLGILERLMGGAAAVSELVAATGASQPNVSNHLTVLRKRGLVRVVPLGRQRVYELRDPKVAQLMESMQSVAGGARTPVVKDTALVQARTCYDHLAGKLGVRIFAALADRDAIRLPEPFAADGRPGTASALELGPRAEAEFARLGISLKDALKRSRSFGYACSDWTERRPHLGGKLGAALWARFVETGWVQRKPGTRAVLVTPQGRRGLSRKLGIAFP